MFRSTFCLCEQLVTHWKAKVNLWEAKIHRDPNGGTKWERFREWLVGTGVRLTPSWNWIKINDDEGHLGQKKCRQRGGNHQGGFVQSGLEGPVLNPKCNCLPCSWKGLWWCPSVQWHTQCREAPRGTEVYRTCWSPIPPPQLIPGMVKALLTKWNDM